MTPYVTDREFERSHNLLREDIQTMKQETADDHKAVLARLIALEKKVDRGFDSLGKVVTWPALATAILVGCAIAGAITQLT